MQENGYARFQTSGGAGDRRFHRHLLVNNAGITGPHEVDIDRYAVEDWQEVIATRLSGTFFGMKYGLPAIVAGGGGR